jgi:hypothetical protein
VENETKEPAGKKQLRGTLPVKEEKRLKLFLYGSAGTGKTTAALQFPNNYIIDTEKGTDQYAKMIKDNGSVVFKTTNFDEAKEEIMALLTTAHTFRTLTIDPSTILYENLCFKWEKKFNTVNDMRRWGRIKADWKAYQHLLLELDMNVIITAHSKILYGDNITKLGDTFDSMKGDDYLFDYVFRIEKARKEGSVPIAITEKQRAEIGSPKFPETFEWSYPNFIKFYGEGMITREATPKVLATEEQIVEFVTLLDIVKIGEDVLSKWGVTDPPTIEEKNELVELESDTLEKRIKYLKSKLPK